MKDWSYYTHQYKHKSISTFKAELREKIDNERMTVAERAEALLESEKTARDLYNQQMKPNNDKQAELDAEFWRDCREDIGYSKFLTDKGCGLLEAEAWYRGHSAGYSEVHNCLIDLAEFAQELIKCRKE